MTSPILSEHDLVERLRKMPPPGKGHYLAFYSSWLGGIVKDPRWMIAPMDDHLVHRGDGVFEAFKSENGKVYALEGHLDRLYISMASISLTAPLSRDEIRRVTLETLRAAGEADLIGRIYISRGPGSFGIDPRDCPQSQIYVVVTKFKKSDDQRYEQGMKVVFSRLPFKDPFYARVKSCNYMPNVLMKMEASQAGADFALSIDTQGCLGEGSTENVAFISEANELVYPAFDGVLKGITLSRVAELARALVDSGDITGISERPVKPEEFLRAREAFLLSTSLDVMPITQAEGRPIGSGRAGPVSKKLLELMRQDVRENAQLLTRIH